MQINTREYQSVNSLAEELTLAENKNYLFNLSYLSTLCVTGDNSQKYLQGQLTCDVNKVTNNNMQPGALCNIQGRIIALLNIIFFNSNYYLILPKDLQEKVRKTLHKTAMFSKVQITNDDGFNIFGFYLQNDQDVLPGMLPNFQHELISYDAYCSYKIADKLYIILTKNDKASALTDKFPKDQLRQDGMWHTILLNSKIYEIYPTSSNIFLPHRLDLQKTDYLSFTKGCFIGQEIIARTQYLAKLKHTMYQYTISTNEKLYSGQKIYKAESTVEIGELVDYSILGDNRYLIACSLIFEHPNIVIFADHSSSTVLNDKI